MMYTQTSSVVGVHWPASNPKPNKFVFSSPASALTKSRYRAPIIRIRVGGGPIAASLAATVCESCQARHCIRSADSGTATGRATAVNAASAKHAILTQILIELVTGLPHQDRVELRTSCDPEQIQQLGQVRERQRQAVFALLKFCRTPGPDSLVPSATRCVSLRKAGISICFDTRSGRIMARAIECAPTSTLTAWLTT